VSKTYGVMSDLHCHAWSAFAGVSPDGINTRLLQILNEIDRCCASVQEEGGRLVVIAGDVFHTRGSVAPSVFNPVRDRFREWASRGITFMGIPGNHDLEGKLTQRLTSAVTMLSEEGVSFWHKPNGQLATVEGAGHMAFMPWIPKQADLLAAIGDLAEEVRDRGELVESYDLFIHAGIDGVLKGMPDHGLTAERLAEFGFRRVFAGHYHHHANMGAGVYSIGSPTHQTWSDVGTKAGWLLVNDGGVRWMASHAPNFIEVTGEEDPDELPLIVDGHYVRARIGKATAAEVAEWRDRLSGMGAKGVLIQSVPAPATEARGAVRAGALHSLEAAVADYAKAQGFAPAVGAICTEILGEVRA